MAITGTITGVGNSVEVSYSGDIQSYTVPQSGTYKLEVWGGQGGTISTSDGTIRSGGGRGGYSQGEIVLTKGQVLYIGIGGAGTGIIHGSSTVVTNAGGYNGGGSGGMIKYNNGFPYTYRGSGGGATHIALGTNRGVLANYASYKSEILIVAGGGGGGGTRWGYNDSGARYDTYWSGGGFGGGITGGSGAGHTDNTSDSHSFGTQTEGGIHGGSGASFGTAGTTSSSLNHSGGGGGWYGGIGIDSWAAGGGSGYVDGLDKGTTIIGINEGNGKAVITYVSTSTTTSNMTKFTYTGAIQSYTVPENGTYKLEVWGAQGGRYRSQTYGGLGGYSYGTIELTKGQVLYIGCGGSGQFCATNAGDTAGGYNGGGGIGGTTFKAYEKATGGGATHIALGTNRGVLANYASYKSEILIVAGGGGGGGSYVNNTNANEAGFEYYSNIDYGSGGGTNGNDGSLGNNATATGASQTAGGTGKGGNGSFGTGGTGTNAYAGAGGGGWYGGGAGHQSGTGSGGSGYIGGVTDGATFTSKNTGDGIAVITLIKKAAPHCYIGSSEVSAIYIGSTNVTEAFIGSVAVS